MITGIGVVAAQPMMDVVVKKPPARIDTPEITGFEVPEGAPTWGYEILDLNLETELPNVKSYLDRTSALALVAGKRALADADLVEREKRPAGLEIGCAFGTMMGCLEAMGIFWNKVKTTNPKFAQPLIFTHGYANSPSSLLCIEHGLRGPAATFSGERLAGMEALMFAYDQIASGAGDAMLVSASESLTQAVWNHFYSRGELSKKGPFGEDGIVLGEGAVALVLESEESAKKRGARIFGELANVCNSTDDGTARAICFARPLDMPLTADGIHADYTYMAGDLLSAEPLLIVAMMTHAMVEWPADGTLVIDSRPIGNNRIQAHIKKS